MRRADAWRGEGWGPRWLPTAGALLVGLAASAFILFANRGTTFILDDWAWLVQRTQALTADALFGSQNGSWATTSVVAYRALAEVFGIGSYVPWRIASLAVHLVCCALIYVIARRRVGPWWALVPLVLVLVSRGWESMLWPFQIGQLFSIACGLGALLLLDRRDVRGDVLASALLVVALASSSYGPPLVLLAAIDLALTRWRALWVLVAPAAAYVWWQDVYNARIPPQGDTSLAGYRHALRMAWDLLPGGPAAALGTSFPVGRIILIAVVLLAIARIGLERRIPARLVAVLVAYVAYWALVAWARAEIPDLGHAPRYLHLAVVLFVLALVELFGGLRTDRWPAGARGRLTRVQALYPGAGTALFVVVTLVAARGVLLTADVMNKGAGATLRVWGPRMLAQQGAYGAGRQALTPASPFFIETSGGFALALPLGSVESTARRYGGTFYPGEHSLRERSTDARAYADQALSRAEGSTVVEPPRAAAGGAGRSPLRLIDATGRVRSSRGCIRWSGANGVQVRVSVPRSGLRVTNRASSGDLAVAPLRWADRALAPQALAHPGQSIVVRMRPDRSRQPWLLQVFGTEGTICPVPTADEAKAARAHR